MQDKLISY